jgi:hypothetical protein
MSAPPPDWLKDLADAAAQLMIPADVMSPIGCHFCQAEGVWEVTIFASSTEIVGGGRDGEVCRSRFTVDVQALSLLLTDVVDISWQAHPLAADDELGPHIAIDGWLGEHQVSLRVLAFPPKRFTPGRRAIGYASQFEDLW